MLICEYFWSSFFGSTRLPLTCEDFVRGTSRISLRILSVFAPECRKEISFRNTRRKSSLYFGPTYSNSDKSQHKSALNILLWSCCRKCVWVEVVTPMGRIYNFVTEIREVTFQLGTGKSLAFFLQCMPLTLTTCRLIRMFICLKAILLSNSPSSFLYGKSLVTAGPSWKDDFVHILFLRPWVSERRQVDRYLRVVILIQSWAHAHLTTQKYSRQSRYF